MNKHYAGIVVGGQSSGEHWSHSRPHMQKARISEDQPDFGGVVPPPEEMVAYDVEYYRHHHFQIDDEEGMYGFWALEGVTFREAIVKVFETFAAYEDMVG